MLKRRSIAVSVFLAATTLMASGNSIAATYYVAPGGSDGGLLERVHDARRSGATILALEADLGTADGELRGLAHEALTVPDGAGSPDFDIVQHLVSAAAGEPSAPAPRGRLLRGALARAMDRLTAAPPPMRW